MKYDLSTALEILVRTPEVLRAQLAGLSDDWLHADEGPGTWSPFHVVGHLIINEQTNFLPRAVLVISNPAPHRTFTNSTERRLQNCLKNFHN